MNTETVAISDLSHDPANARVHNEKNLQAIIGSLRAFGQQKPIVVDSRGVVVAGNGTMAAATALGWTEIAIVRTELDPTMSAAFAIADNRTAELAIWDYEILQSTVESLAGDQVDIASLGFDETDLDSILGVDFKSDNLHGNEGYEANADRHTVHFHGDAWPRIDAIMSKAEGLPGDEAEAIVAVVEAWAKHVHGDA